MVASGRLRQNCLGYTVNSRTTWVDPVSTNQQINQSKFGHSTWCCAYRVSFLPAPICFFEDCVLLLIQHKGFIHSYWIRRFLKQLRAFCSSKFRAFPRSFFLSQRSPRALLSQSWPMPAHILLTCFPARSNSSSSSNSNRSSSSSIFACCWPDFGVSNLPCKPARDWLCWHCSFLCISHTLPWLMHHCPRTLGVEGMVTLSQETRGPLSSPESQPLTIPGRVPR